MEESIESSFHNQTNKYVHFGGIMKPKSRLCPKEPTAASLVNIEKIE